MPPDRESGVMARLPPVLPPPPPVNTIGFPLLSVITSFLLLGRAAAWRDEVEIPPSDERELCDPVPVGVDAGPFCGGGIIY